MVFVFIPEDPFRVSGSALIFGNKSLKLGLLFAVETNEPTSSFISASSLVSGDRRAPDGSHPASFKPF